MRARELGLYFGPLPTGLYNAITDVPQVRVGHVSLIQDTVQGQFQPGYGRIRTGVTAILAHAGNLYRQKYPASVYNFNGYGKSSGTIWVEEIGLCENPILLTNTLSTPLVRQGGLQWVLHHNGSVGITDRTPNLLVFECDDGYLNDIRCMQVKPDHAIQAINSATGGPVPEGNVGAGVGLSLFEFKGGIGTSSRIVKNNLGVWTVGVLTQANFGKREDLIIKGIPVGEFLPNSPEKSFGNSIITVIATDAPLDKKQMMRFVRRPVLGISRTGFISRHGSGDIIVAFSNYPWTHGKMPPVHHNQEEEEQFLDPLFKAVADATEEAVLNALFQAETMIGVGNHIRHRIPLDKVREILSKYTRV